MVVGERSKARRVRRGREGERIASLALQGPNARVIWNNSTQKDLSGVKYFLTTAVQGIPVTITRTGYTGDLGYELWVGVEGRDPGLGCASSR
ncbi:MAG: hypothetical protein U0163_01775 [Gemmatimonadaceae bacterium]